MKNEQKIGYNLFLILFLWPRRVVGTIVFLFRINRKIDRSYSNIFLDYSRYLQLAFKRTWLANTNIYCH